MSGQRGSLTLLLDETGSGVHLATKLEELRLG